jgi:hypothetical protein
VRRRLWIALAAAAALPVSSAAAAPAVSIMVVGRHGTLLPARTVRARAASVRIGHRRCAVPGATALSALIAAHVRFRVTDAAGCDPAAMFVRTVDQQTGRGRAGWEYKIGHLAPSLGAGDPGGRLRRGQELLWFWCVDATACQRTLATMIAFDAAGMRVHVLGYDDNGHRRSIAGATVHVGQLTAVTDGSGWATFTLVPGQYRVYATKPGLVPSFPTQVGVVT